MITNLDLEKFKRQNIDDVEIDNLKDISEIIIDKSKPIAERVRSFMEQTGNPYLFKVGNTPVKTSFASNAPSLQKSLEKLFTKEI